ncbi:MAG: sigma-70 family RNA polymerase sigma factor [Brevundimonas sp.]|jgi:RNA polymerase sigma-70 factor (ECF subfamily)|uniref:RNA polymerase sigma factor n=1 Tax=Brevundimonas sp. TaxID=1871086 RepID=UPI0017BBDEBC|nr:sigma-70 family RNA polymerase sigma factor [Brevundimonas sp.]MBA4805143.1 sigma-70 family RNA polymerase sigma factor [Brevundimonas sp.]
MREDARQRLVTWVATSVMPHEGRVRGWLRQRLQSPEDIDDLIQEAYARLAALDRFDHIARPDTFFFQIVRNLLVDQIRRSRVVRIEAATELDVPSVYDETPTPERIAGARRELARVGELIEGLPERCRKVFTLRKVEGLSQKEVAERLGVSESVVENEGAKGIRLILRAMREETVDPEYRSRVRDERATKRQ